MKIPTEDIIIPPDRQKRADEDLRELMRSLEEFGQLQPICVDVDGDKFRLVFGGRRLEALKKLGISKVWAITKDKMTDLQRKEHELEENLQRKQFSPVEKSQALRDLFLLKKQAYEEVGNDLFGIRYYSQQKFAEEIKIDQAAVSRAIKLADAADSYPELHSCQSNYEAEKLLRRILLEKKIGKPRKVDLELPKDIVGEILNNPPFRFIYAILAREELDLVFSLEAVLDPFSILAVETEYVGQHPIFHTKPTILSESGKEGYREIYFMARGMTNLPISESVLSFERNPDFNYPASHNITFWQRVLRNVISENAQNKNILFLNPNDLSMTEICFTKQYKVRYLFTDSILHQQLTSYQKAHNGNPE